MAFSWEELDWYRCPACRSVFFTHKWTLGYGKGLRLTLWSDQRIRHTHVYRDFFSADHKHEWTSVAGNVRRGIPAAALGPVCYDGARMVVAAQMNKFTDMYEGSPPFRDFVKNQIGRGELTENQVRQLVQMPREAFSDQDLPAADSELAKKALQLEEDFDRFERAR
jgi:hypothetical protein